MKRGGEAGIPLAAVCLTFGSVRVNEAQRLSTAPREAREHCAMISQRPRTQIVQRFLQFLWAAFTA